MVQSDHDAIKKQLSNYQNNEVQDACSSMSNGAEKPNYFKDKAGFSYEKKYVTWLSGTVGTDLNTMMDSFPSLVPVHLYK